MNDSDDRNHKVILEYLQKVLERERDRFYKLDDKVSKLFTTVSTVITGFLIIVNILNDSFIKIYFFSIFIIFPKPLMLKVSCFF